MLTMEQAREIHSYNISKSFQQVNTHPTTHRHCFDYDCKVTLIYNRNLSNL